MYTVNESYFWDRENSKKCKNCVFKIKDCKECDIKNKPPFTLYGQ